MNTPAAVPTDEVLEAALRAWDWVAELDRQERTISWLARRMDVHYRNVYRYARGELTPPIGWLAAAARALGVLTEIGQ